eukprot:848701-Pleurochrysis_carterae.AAC.1
MMSQRQMESLNADGNANHLVYETQYDRHEPWTTERIKQVTCKLLALSQEPEASRTIAIARDQELREFQKLHPITVRTLTNAAVANSKAHMAVLERLLTDQARVQSGA